MRQSRSMELATAGRTAPMHTCAAAACETHVCFLLSTIKALAAIPVVAERCAKAAIARQQTKAAAFVEACAPGLLQRPGIRAATEPA